MKYNLAGRGAGREKIQWDDSEVHLTRLPNVCNVTLAEEAVTLHFGLTEPAQAGEDICVRLRERVVLTPAAAKLLGLILNGKVAEFEATYGAIPAHFNALPGSATLPAPGPRRTPEPGSGDLPESGLLMLELIRDLNLEHYFERSFKLLEGRLLKDRFLLGIARDGLSPQAATRLPVICRRLAMPDAFADRLREDWDRADFVHFGFEAGEGATVYKVYLEFARDLEQAMQRQFDVPEELLLYIGYKWHAEDNGRQAVSEYRCRPKLAAEGIRTRIVRRLEGAAHDIPRTIVEELLDLAAGRAPADQLLYTEVSEAGNPRSSFDLNLYAADLRLAEIYPLLLRAGVHHRVPADDLRAAYDPVRDQPLGHVSGGIDRAGRSFLTIYFGGRKRLP